MAAVLTRLGSDLRRGFVGGNNPGRQYDPSCREQLRRWLSRSRFSPCRRRERCLGPDLNGYTLGNSSMSMVNTWGAQMFDVTRIFVTNPSGQVGMQNCSSRERLTLFLSLLALMRVY